MYVTGRHDVEGHGRPSPGECQLVHPHILKHVAWVLISAGALFQNDSKIRY